MIKTSYFSPRGTYYLSWNRDSVKHCVWSVLQAKSKTKNDADSRKYKQLRLTKSNTSLL